METYASSDTANVKKSWLDFFKPAPPAAVKVADPAVIKRDFRKWQWLIMIGTLVGYALFYFVRKNLSPSMAGEHGMLKSLNFTKDDLGSFLTYSGLTYGLSKFINGFVADRTNAARFMTFALIASAVVNIFLGFSSTLWIIGMLCILNGWVQGMGFPPIARLMTHWFSPKELATKMSIWNTSHSIGGALVTVLCAYLVQTDWRLCFFVPAALALVFAIFLPFLLRDNPSAIGLPEISGTERTEHEDSKSPEFKAFVKKHVFCNKYIWLLALANFFVYVIRAGVFDWGILMMTESKAVKVIHAGWILAGFEVSGVVGMLVSGWLTDRLFAGRCARMCFFCMALAAASVFAFWKIPAHHMGLSTAALCSAGFFIYAPQALIGIASANLATKRAAATAVGLTGLFGYLSTTVSGKGVAMVQKWGGWDAVLLMLILCGAIGTVLFAMAWGAKASGYAEEHPSPAKA